MKSILLPIHDDEGQPARISAAIALAKALDGELLCVDVIETPVLIADYFSAAGRSMLEADEEWWGRRNRDRVAIRLEREAIRHRWLEAKGGLDACIVSAADLADIIIVSRNAENPLGFNFRPLILRAARKAKPVLSIPSQLFDFRPEGRAMIAWDGSTSATDMLRACTPLLRHAAAVQLFCVLGKEGAIPATEAAEYLSRHNIHPTIKTERDGFHPDADVLRVQAKLWHADYCVMGAFGDNHLRHYLFGSTTRRMLETGDLPIILGR